MISEAAVNNHADTRVADLKNIWQGGADIELAMPMNNTGGLLTNVTSEDILDLVRRLAERYDDKTIAAIFPPKSNPNQAGLFDISH